MSKEWKRFFGRILKGLFYLTVLVIAVVCLVGLSQCYVSFQNTSTFLQEQSAKAMSAITDALPQADTKQLKNIESLVSHMETILEIQQGNLTNNLMSFVYGVLSAMLVGLCAGYAIKGQKDAQRAKDTADEAERAAKLAKEHAEAAGARKQEVENIRSDIDKQSRHLSNLENYDKILQIHVEICYANVSLRNMDRVDANRRFTAISNHMERLQKTEGSSFDESSISQLLDELLRLETRVDEFKDRAEEQKGRNEMLVETFGSFEQAAVRYHKQLDASIKICKAILEDMQNAV